MNNILFFRNDGSKLSKQLLSLVQGNENSNNYKSTHIRVEIKDNILTVETLCHSGGDSWYNDNSTEVLKSELPYFTAKKLGVL